MIIRHISYFLYNGTMALASYQKRNFSDFHPILPSMDELYKEENCILVFMSCIELLKSHITHQSFQAKACVVLSSCSTQRQGG